MVIFYNTLASILAILKLYWTQKTCCGIHSYTEFFTD